MKPQWLELIGQTKGEAEKRRCLINLVSWSLGFGGQQAGLTSNDLKDNKHLQKKLIDWLFWKWAAVRDFGLGQCTKDAPGYELWSLEAYKLLKSNSRTTTGVTQEHPIPRKVLANQLLNLKCTKSDFRSKVEQALWLSCLEVTMTQKEAKQLDSPVKKGLGLKQEAPGFNIDEPETVWCRYNKLREVEEFKKFQVVLVSWWKVGRKWQHAVVPDINPVFPCVKT